MLFRSFSARRARCRCDGFTLIELLVAIGIIAVLISFLLPTLSSAKASSRSTTCMSNVRQLTVAMESYAVDHEEHYARLFEPAQGTYLPWALNDYIATNAAWLCPEATHEWDAFSGNKYDPHTSYGMSRWLGLSSRPPVHRNEVKNPGETVAFMDNLLQNGTFTQAYGVCGVEPEHPSAGNPVYRHSELAPVSFVDGHADYQDDERLEATATQEAGRVLVGKEQFVLWNLF